MCLKGVFLMTINVTEVKTVKVKWSRYSPGVAQSVGRGTALLFHDRGTRSGWVVSSTPHPQVTPRKDLVPNFSEGLVCPRAGLDERKISSPPGMIPDRPARSQIITVGNKNNNESIWPLFWSMQFCNIFCNMHVNSFTWRLSLSTPVLFKMPKAMHISLPASIRYVDCSSSLHTCIMWTV